MNHHRIEQELKTQLNNVDDKLKQARNLQSVAWIGSAVGTGVLLAPMTSHVPILVGMVAGGCILNLAATCFLSKKRTS